MRENKFDPSLNILYRRHQQLDSIFYPKSVAIIGARDKEGTVGRTILWNLLRSPFGGIIYPINPKRKSVFGIKCYPSIKDIPETVDLAIVAVNAGLVPDIINECSDAKVSSAIIVSAGFTELGEKGKILERKIRENAKKGRMRIIGPNCLGVMNPVIGLNATFAADIALNGNIAFISQSGALCTAVLDWSIKEKVGFSAFVSIGSMIDVNWGDLINYFGNDSNTESILIYMEEVKDARAFLSAAREVALTKPIILIKAGITEESAKAAESHTGALSGRDDVLNAALRRVGVLRVDSIADLFSMAELLSKHPKPKGANLTIISNAGGPAVIATDSLIKNGGSLTKISLEIMECLNGFLPDAWSRNNPIDILGDASAETYAKTLEIAVKDENAHGILAIVTPQYMTDSTAIAKELAKHAHDKQKPILASWMGAKSVEEGIEILTDNQISCFSFPDEACKAFAYMWKYSFNLLSIYETPFVRFSLSKESERFEKVKQIFSDVRKDKRTVLTEVESKAVLEAYDIKTAITYPATTKKEAVDLAKKIGFPVVLKLLSKKITHKSDVGGVKLNLNTENEVEQAFDEIFQSIEEAKCENCFDGVSIQPMMKLDGYEIILGSSVDPQFGPVLLFGMGGQLTEVFTDYSLGLPPLNFTLAKRMMQETKIYKALKGFRGKKAVNKQELMAVLVKFSKLIASFSEISECDINPLLVSEDKIIALDARIVLFDESVKKENLPKLAIRPYPHYYIKNERMKDNTPVKIRPIRPEDEYLMVKFFQDVSKKSVFNRYLKVVHYDELITKERLIRICFNDYDREIALVVVLQREGFEKEIIGVGRLTKIAGTDDAMFALMIQDTYHHQGLGTKLLEMLIDIAKNEKVHTVIAHLRPENNEMQAICIKLGFNLIKDEKTDLIRAELKI